MKSKLFLFLLSGAMMFSACKKDSGTVLGGDQSPMGEVG